MTYQIDNGMGEAIGSDGWVRNATEGTSRRATAAEMAAVQAYGQQPSTQSGWAERDRQAAADKDWDLPGGALVAGLTGLGFAGGFEGLSSIFGGSGGGAAAGAGGAMDMGVGLPEWMNSLNTSAGASPASWGVSTPGGGTWFKNLLGSAGDTGAENMFGFQGAASVGGSGGFQMPAAIPETPAQLAEWGLKETSPGNWSLPNVAGSASTATDWLSKIASDPKTWGSLLSTGLGIYGSNQQSKSLEGLANRYDSFGAPSRARFEASMTPGFDPSTQIPGYSGALKTSMDQMMASLSAQGGNPFGNPSGLMEANKRIVAGTALPAINEYQRLNANTGFGNSMNAALNLQTQGVGADANSLNALGYGINSLTNPQPSLAELLKQLQGGGYKLNDGASL